MHTHSNAQQTLLGRERLVRQHIDDGVPSHPREGSTGHASALLPPGCGRDRQHGRVVSRPSALTCRRLQPLGVPAGGGGYVS
jgi:hypothetical protein